MGIQKLSLKKYAAIVGGAALLLVVVAFLGPLMGSSALDVGKVFDTSLRPNPDANIFFVHRLPHTLLAILVGGALSTSGCVFQALLRNPLATPYTLGIASGGSLGAVVSIVMGVGFAYGIQLFALAGVGLAVCIVFSLSNSRHRLPTTTLLLTGVTMAFFFSALILYFLCRMDPNDAIAIVHWMMGGLDRFDDARTLVYLAPLFLFVLIPLLLLAKPLNVLSVSEDVAMSLGVDPEKTKRQAFVAASVLTGLAVSLAGPIGFVGLIVPHIVRLIFGQDHRVLIPLSFLLGGVFLVVCDIVARSHILVDAALPVGVVTALCGAPFFLWLLKSRRRSISL